jgi:hypothetical protein
MRDWLVTIETEPYDGPDADEVFERFVDYLESASADTAEFPSGSLHAGAFAATFVIAAEKPEQALTVATRLFVGPLDQAIGVEGQLPAPARALVEAVNSDDRSAIYA